MQRKLLVSDYDGTFLCDNDISLNIDSVNNFVSNGNLFALATGRNYNSIKKETMKYNIPYDYLICNNGTSIFDSDDNLILNNSIHSSKVLKAYNYLTTLSIISTINFYDIYGNQTLKYYNVAEIICTVKISDIRELINIKEDINTILFLDSISFTRYSKNFDTIDFVLNNDAITYLILKEYIDKKNGITFISEIESIDKSDIYTIGNDSNDYEMLNYFNGYKMLNSRKCISSLDVPVIESVYKLIKRIG